MSIPQLSLDALVDQSFAQQRLWFVDELYGGDSSIYNVPFAIRIRGPLDTNALQSSLNEIRRRHEALRTRFLTIDGVAKQLIEEPSPFPFEKVDLTGHPDVEDTLKKALAAYQREPFKLSIAPPVRSVLFHLESDVHVFMLVMHHIVTDGWSFGIFKRELSTLYKAYLTGDQSPLPDLPIQYKDYSLWQRQVLMDGMFNDGITFWKKALRGVPHVLDLPTDRSRPPVQSSKGASYAFHLDRGLTDKLKNMGNERGSTLFMTLMAGFRILLFRYSGQEDFLIGTPVANRGQIEIEPLIGFFVNTLVVRGNLSGNPSCEEVLRRERDLMFEYLEHQQIPFEQLVEELQTERYLNRNPLFQVLFAMQNTPRNEMVLSGTQTIRETVKNETSRTDLALSMSEDSSGLHGRVEYSTDLFDGSTIEQMMSHFELILQQVIDEPEVPVGDLSIVTEKEKFQILQEWNDTQTPYPRDLTVNEVFEQQAKQTPDAIALYHEGTVITYEELNGHANCLARHLVELGVGENDIVGLCMHRSPDYIIGMLAILKAGGAFVPFDPSYPENRLSYMFNDCNLDIVITHSHLHNITPDGSWTLFDIDTFLSRNVGLDRKNLERRSKPENVAYLIYTSGSTGEPKGSLNLHMGLVRLVKNSVSNPFRHDQTALLLSPISFDASLFQIWTPLLNGGRLVVPPPGQLSARELGDIIREQEVTWLCVPSGLLQVMVDERIDDLEGVRHLISSGDVVSPSHVRRLLDYHKELKFTNAYGPTECSVGAAGCDFFSGDHVDTNVPIGRPFSNNYAYVLDQNQNLLPVGVPGELYLGGDGVGIGYLNRPDLTAEHFVKDPFLGSNTGLMYRTGDLCRWLKNGYIEYLGRVDRQVKLRGYRIELAEIEAALNEHPSVSMCAIHIRKDTSGDQMLIAYIVSIGNFRLNSTEMRTYLGERLPRHMVPNEFFEMDELPMTPSGKVDRSRLPDPVHRSEKDQSPGQSPTTIAELAVIETLQDLLNTEAVSLSDNFFDIGGHSLLAIRFVSRIEQSLGAEIPLALLFECSTLQHLSDLIDQLLQKSGGDTASFGELEEINI